MKIVILVLNSYGQSSVLAIVITVYCQSFHIPVFSPQTTKQKGKKQFCTNVFLIKRIFIEIFRVIIGFIFHHFPKILTIKIWLDFCKCMFVILALIWYFNI